MNNHRNIQDYIDQYYSGEISDADFQKRLEVDKELEVEFLKYKQDLKIIRAAAKEQLKSQAKHILATQEQKQAKVFNMPRIISIAAAIALLITSFFIFQKMGSPISTTDLFAAHFELPDPAGERNASPQTESWNEAMAAYSNQDYKRTIELLTPLVRQADFPFADRGNLYVGLSQLMQDENQKAITHFDAINPESSFVQDAEWFRALAFLKMENIAEAKKSLQKIVDQPRHFKHAEALEILDNLQ